MNETLGNLDSLRTAMDNGEFDAIIAMSPENVPYTAGVGIWSKNLQILGPALPHRVGLREWGDQQ